MQRGSFEAPLLCVTVLDEGDANPELVERLIREQGVGRVMLCVHRGLAAPLRERLFSLPSSTAVIELPTEACEDTERYWHFLVAYFEDAECDVLIARAGTWLPALSWLRFYRTPSGVDRAICASVVFPLSVRSAISGVFSSPDHDPRLASQAIDRWLGAYADQVLFDTPVAPGFTGLFRASRYRAGYRYVVNPTVYADDRAHPVVPLPADTATGYRDAFLQRHPLTALRHAMTQLSSRCEHPPEMFSAPAPVRLHLAHGWGGGLAQWVEDFAAADSQARSLLLRPIGDRNAFGQTLVLVDLADPDTPLEQRTLTSPILSTALRHVEYDDFLRFVVAKYSVNTMIVSSLIGHSLDCLGTGLPTIAVMHNYFPVCPAIVATFDQPCSGCERDRLADCLQRNPNHRFFLSEDIEHWIRIRAAFAAAVEQRGVWVVAPSATVLERTTALLGQGLPDGGVVIPHGLPSSEITQMSAARRLAIDGAGRLRVMVLGGEEAHKGGALAEHLVTALGAEVAFTLLGFGDSLSSRTRAAADRVIDRYRREELGALTAELRPHVAALLSTVPETFSYTLSEMQAAGIPVIATDIGAFTERIEHGRTGWLVAPQGDALCRALRGLDGDRAGLGSARERLVATEPRDAAAMVEDYLTLLPPFSFAAAGRPPVRVSSPGASRGLLVAADTRYVDALRGFVKYTRTKAASSPRLPRWLRKLARCASEP